MRPILATAMLAIICGCATVPEKQMFTTKDFNHLKFLEGRWVGKAPNGAPFYEEYTFLGSEQMRSDRHADSSYSKSTDGSIVTLANGQVTSTWNTFTWVASELAPGRACFTPVNAPSSFCWERKSDSETHVTQRWTDDSGKPQEYVVVMHRPEV